MVMPKSNVPTPPNGQQKPKIVVGTSGVPTPPNSTTQTVNRVSTPQPPTSSVPTPPKGISAAPAITSTPSMPQSNVPIPPKTNYAQELDNMLNQYRQMTNTPFQYNPATDPSYQAYQQLAQGRANEAARLASKNTLETMNERGIINSSVTSNQLGQIEHQARQNAELEALAAIPQFQQQAYNQYQDRMGNLFNLADMYARRDNTMFDREQTEFSNRVTLGELLGTYQDPELMNLYNQVLQQKESYANARTDEERQLANQTANQLRARIEELGGDPNLIGADVTLDQARSNRSQFGIPTLQREMFESGQQMEREKLEYQRSLDAWDMAFRQENFNWQKAQQLWENEFRDKSFEQGVREFSQQMGLDWTRLNEQQKQFAAEMAYKNRALEKSQNANMSTSIGPNDYKTSPDFATDYQYIVSNPEAAKQQLQNNAAAFIQTYGYDGYRALLAALPKEDQNELERFLTGG